MIEEDFKPSILEKFLIGTGIVENLSATALGLTTNMEPEYLVAGTITSVVNFWLAGGSILYRAGKKAMNTINYENH